MEFNNPTSNGIDGRLIRRMYDVEVAELRAHPGNWGIVREDAPSRYMAKHIRRGMLAAFRPEGAFDAVARKNDDGTYRIYAMALDESRATH